MKLWMVALILVLAIGFVASPVLACDHGGCSGHGGGQGQGNGGNTNPKCDPNDDGCGGHGGGGGCPPNGH